MKNLPIDWDSVPDVMNKDQFYRLCHMQVHGFAPAKKRQGALWVDGQENTMQ